MLTVQVRDVSGVDAKLRRAGALGWSPGRMLKK
jgi:hypothetical protein